MRVVFAVIVLIGASVPSLLFAHQRSESFSQWSWNNGLLEMRFTVAEREVRRITPQANALALASYLEGLVEPDDEGAGCIAAGNLTVQKTRQSFFIARSSWRCTRVPKRLKLSAFFDRAAEHTHLSTYEDGELQLQAFVHETQPYWDLGLAIPRDALASDTGKWGGFLKNLAMGFWHALGGYDHLLFLLALILVCSSLKSLVWAITGFTIGHTTSLFLAAYGVVVPVVPVVEATIGLTIALVAAERLKAGPIAASVIGLGVAAVILLAGFIGYSNSSFALVAGLALFTVSYLILARQSGDSGWFRLSITVLFGLIHGFGFATAFQVVSSPGKELIGPILGFNLGVEAGQILAVILALAAGHLIVRFIGEKPIAAEWVATAVFSIGTFWFVARSFGA